LADLANSFWIQQIDTLVYEFENPDEWLELQIFDRFDTVEQEVILG
jgi:hypothetical protein